jgi:hypothetical protein
MTPQSQPGLDEFAGAPLDDSDARLLEQVAHLYGVLDPVPDGLVDRVQFGITLDALHAELAELQRAGDLVGVRSEPTTDDAQTVTFTSSTLTTMVTITTVSADRVRIDGWVAPACEAAVDLRLVGATLHSTCDADGRFVFNDVPRGLAQFVLRAPRELDDDDERAVVTPSITL